MILIWRWQQTQLSLWGITEYQINLKGGYHNHGQQSGFIPLKDKLKDMQPSKLVSGLKLVIGTDQKVWTGTKLQ